MLLGTVPETLSATHAVQKKWQIVKNRNLNDPFSGFPLTGCLTFGEEREFWLVLSHNTDSSMGCRHGLRWTWTGTGHRLTSEALWIPFSEKGVILLFLSHICNKTTCQGKITSVEGMACPMDSKALTDCPIFNFYSECQPFLPSEKLLVTQET